MVRIRVRPPHSKDFELGETEMRQHIGIGKDPSKTVTNQAQAIFTVIKRHGSQRDSLLNMSKIAALAGISSKRRFVELIGELERAGDVRTKTLMERGQPRIIELAEIAAS